MLALAFPLQPFVQGRRQLSVAVGRCTKAPNQKDWTGAASPLPARSIPHTFPFCTSKLPHLQFNARTCDESSEDNC